jgi:hypothetical protein
MAVVISHYWALDVGWNEISFLVAPYTDEVFLFIVRVTQCREIGYYHVTGASNLLPGLRTINGDRKSR